MIRIACSSKFVIASGIINYIHFPGGYVIESTPVKSMEFSVV